MAETEIIRNADNRVDELEATMLDNMVLIDCPIVNRFTDGMYIREIFMQPDALVVSRCHRTEHPFVVSFGAVWVKIDTGEWELIQAPHTSITKPGTRRVLYVPKDSNGCVWTTFHINADNCTDIETIENRLLEPHINSITGTDIHKDYLEALKQQELITQ